MSLDNTAIVLPQTSAPVDADADLEVLRTVPEKFAIVDENSANWLVRKIITARDYGDRVKAWSEQEIRRAQREEQTLLFLFGRQLEEWARGEIGKLNGRRKSVNLPGGCIGFRTVSPCLQVDDENLVLRWAKQNCPSAIVIVERLSRAVLKEYFEKTGALPDAGAHVEPNSEKFFVR